MRTYYELNLREYADQIRKDPALPFRMKMKIYFIDVARCRIRLGFAMPYVVKFDLYTPLRDLQLPTEESLEFLRIYHEYFPECPFSLSQLEKRLRKYRRHRETFNVVDCG